MSIPHVAGGHALGPGEGEALWFNRGLGPLKATTEQTEGRFAVLEVLAPRGFASPIHIHRAEDEFFVVLSGEVRVKHGDEVIDAVAGSLVYGPRGVAHPARRTAATGPPTNRRESRSSARAASRPGSWDSLRLMSSSWTRTRSRRS
jgi:quercetin dioxygenase-like cupin family protein